MARIKTQDLIITVDPCLDSKNIKCVSSGVVAKCVSSTSLKPVPSCVSSKKFQVQCLSSSDPGGPTTIARMNRGYQKQLRESVRAAADERKVRIPFPAHIEVLLKEMSPGTAREIRTLQRIFRNALKDLERMQRDLTRRGR